MTIGALDDGMTVIEHIEQQTPLSTALLTISSVDSDTLREGFLRSLYSADSVATSSERVKQVYFPVDGEYHLLSIMRNSGLIFEVRNRIESSLFDENAQSLKELRIF